jgi:hypothetical protein
MRTLVRVPGGGKTVPARRRRECIPEAPLSVCFSADLAKGPPIRPSIAQTA